MRVRHLREREPGRNRPGAKTTLTHVSRGNCRRFTLIALLFAACKSNPPSPTIGEAWQHDAPRPGSPSTESPAPNHVRTASRNDLEQPSTGDSITPPASAGAVASVNGQTITRDWLSRELIASHGLSLLTQKVALEVVRQEAQKGKLVLSPAEIDAEYDLTLRFASMTEAERKALTPQRRAQLIEQWRQSRGVSVEELRLAMERQALLRKLAAERLTVNESMLRDEFARIYGTKVECRHIVVASLRDADKLRTRLDAGDDFATLARRSSINNISAPDGGSLPPFSQNDETIPALLREAAFRMEPGQVSNPIQINGQIHLLKLERRIAPTIITFESVRAAVESALRDRLTPVRMETLLSSLQEQAVLKIDDPVLRQQYHDAVKSGRLTGPALGG